MTEGVVAAIFSIVGTAIGGFIGYSTSISVAARKEFNSAAIDFQEAFLDAVMSLDQRFYTGENKSTNTHEILSRTFPGQIKAMLRFRQYLPSDKRESFDRAWREYCHYDVDGEPNYPFLEQYFEKKWEGKYTKDLALERINVLLSFAKLNHKSPFEPEEIG